MLNTKEQGSDNETNSVNSSKHLETVQSEMASDTTSTTAARAPDDAHMPQGEYDLIHRDLEKLSDSEVIPQKRLFSVFYSKSMPDVPQSDSDRRTISIKSWNVFSVFLFTWCFNVIRVGYKRTIQPNDLMKLDEGNKVEVMYDQFLVYWEESLARKRTREAQGKKDPKFSNVSIVWALLKTFKFRYSYAIFSVIVSNLSVALSPLVFKHLIAFVAEKQVDKSLKINRGVGYAIAAIVLSLINAIFISQGMFNGFLVGCQVRSVLTKALLQKSFKLSAKGKHNFPQSKIATMATTDTSRIESAFAFHPMLWGFPGAFIVTIYLLIYNIGPVALVGLGFFILSLFVSFLGFNFVVKYRLIANKYTDSRVSLVREIVASLKTIKYYAWEDAYSKLISEKRSKEVKQVRKMQFYTSYVISYGVMVPTIASLITFLCLYQIKGNHSAAVVFSSLSLFQVLSGQMFIIPQVLTSSVNGFIALGRIQECLMAEELLEDDECDVPCKNPDNALELDNCSYKWEVFAVNDDKTKDEADETEKQAIVESTEIDDSKSETTGTAPNAISRTAFKGLNGLNFNVKKGEFIVITGAIGTGKSSLLLALTRLMKQTAGELRQTGDLLFCGQPWIQNATIKENITFGSDYNENKYRRVLDICCLNDDLDILAARDYTEIGEKGINLSGGQKARLNLARTVYREVDIYLFDDILSAVDARVGKYIMENCILGLLAGKTRILATHQLNLISDADRVIFLGADGSISIDTMDALMAHQPEFKELLSNTNTAKMEKEVSSQKDSDNSVAAAVGDKSASGKEQPASTAEAIAAGQLVEKEERAVNSIGFEVYRKYFSAGAGSSWWVSVVLFLFVLAINTFFNLFSSVWLSFWNEMKWKQQSKGFYMGIYSLWSGLAFISTLGGCLMILVVGLNASKKLHNDSIKNVLRAPMSFIDVTPMGRILNRFTKDMDVLDSQLPFNVLMAIYSLFSIIGVVIMCIIYIPWFAIALPFFALAYVVISSYYQSSAREVKRLEAVQRSFVFNNFNEVLSGIDTIKSFKLPQVFLKKEDFLINKQNEATILYVGLQRWSSVWIVLIGVCFTAIITFLCVARTFSIGAASTGLLLNYAFQMTDSLEQLLFETTQLENNMNSTERVVAYSSNLPQEKPYTIAEMKPAETWPQNGAITFSNVSLAYRPGLPLVLKNINLVVQGGEKVGVCGRTGAGKSTIMSALYRIVELATGQVSIDGVDISKIGLYDLRSQLSIIPQEPVLFEGDIKKNLDPFGDSTDDVLWNALVAGGAIQASELAAVKAQQIKEGQSNDEVHRFHLYQPVTIDGANFSLGERQLLTLARALVRKSKILILDEATSSVDYETDAKIQAKISEGFNNSTILCIAHRLNTIINYDKILVLDKGEVAEYDTPWNLFHQPSGIFRDMCLRSGISEADFKV